MEMSFFFSTKTQQKHIVTTYLTQLKFIRLAVSACQNIHVYVFSFYLPFVIFFLPAVHLSRRGGM